MEEIRPMDVLFEAAHGPCVRLPQELARLYGPLRLPDRPGRPCVISDYVATMDGVVSLEPPGPAPGPKTPGQLISGDSAADKLVLALVHALADVLLIGDSGVRGNPRDARRAEAIYPPLADEFRQLRAELGKPPRPPVVVLSPEGHLDPASPLFHARESRLAILTAEETAAALPARGFPPDVAVLSLPRGPNGLFTARSVLAAVQRFQPSRLVLCDAGPRFMAHLIAERCLDELFLTIAPQLAGRDAAPGRPGLVQGRLFAPVDPRHFDLVSIRRAGHHLLLRYRAVQGIA
ncbi:dihydrofolate reductase family protein [Streptomyces sp. NRRL F-2664]|uniref:dihydrofolate reductase family protein n=1 Tax=Streptomyces sp. NRRL F-2664 TaxID=1463842 RepID=UPI0004C52D11|nr:dihydrofolate reductase family protein [Streptomyces sp. NRRL F-2664]